METLKEIFSKIGHFGSDIGCNDKGGTHSYIETYDKIFSAYRNNCSFLEIGLAMGDSIKLFDEYFVDSKITGVDISVIFQPIPYKNKVDIIQADATKPEFLEKIKDRTFDIVIDDGSHMYEDQKATFMMLKNKMNKGGVYIIEDIIGFDISKRLFPLLHDNCEIIDLRSVKGRFDDALIIYRF